MQTWANVGWANEETKKLTHPRRSSKSGKTTLAISTKDNAERQANQTALKEPCGGEGRPLKDPRERGRMQFLMERIVQLERLILDKDAQIDRLGARLADSNILMSHMRSKIEQNNQIIDYFEQKRINSNGYTEHRRRSTKW